MARHSLSDWLKNASADTLESSGLRRKATKVDNLTLIADDGKAGGKVRGKARNRQPEHDMQVALIKEARRNGWHRTHHSLCNGSL